jgi:aminomethyltransferase
MNYYSFTTGEIAGIKDVIISATGYTGAGGFELYFYNKDAVKIWNTIFDSGKTFGLKPIGLGARDTLRLEMGYCLYGNDIDDTTSPLEAGLNWITKFENYKDFIDKSFLERQLKSGVIRKLVGFKMIDRCIPRHDYEIKDDKGNKIGKVTSGTMSPIIKQGIGMGYVQTEFSKPGNIIFINIREKLLKAEIVKPPFV